MIHKILTLKNVGTFKNVSFGGEYWNGIFEKTNAFYADNGSGKTTFTQILRSISSKPAANALLQKHTFGATDKIDLSYLDENKKLLTYKSGAWPRYDNAIDIFDSYFIEDNVYVITLDVYSETDSNFDIVVGKDAIDTYKEMESLKETRKKEKNKRANLRRKLKSITDSKEIRRINKIVSESNTVSQKISQKLHKLEIKQAQQAEDFGKKYLEKINKYLKRLGTDLILTKLNKKARKLIYHISISEHELRSDSASISLRHTLSEGEKNCLAFSFFLAEVEMRNDMKNRTIVFDDPISSLDNNRRSITLNILTRVAKEAKQFILLSHDIHFIKDFKEKINDTLVLKIVKTKDSSRIVPFDVQWETLTGIFKDITVLRDFADNGEMSTYNHRDVVRCIRPVLEGLFRIKYYTHIKRDEWLGDFIAKIRDAKEGEPFSRQKDCLTDLEDLNDYSKTYHHSNPNYMEEPIIASELQNYCRLAFAVMERI